MSGVTGDLTAGGRSPDEPEGSGDIAVVGLAGRFPGAPDVDTFWRNLLDGTESLTVLADQADPADPGFVPAYGVLEGADEFDAGFFGYAPNEALVIDPQQRVLLEVAHEALERAGHADPGSRTDTGVFAGGTTTDYANTLLARLHQLPFVDEWQVRLATGPDFLATRIAYKLGLGGPAVTIQTACSTGLVATHMAIQSLLAGDCGIAVAGGAAVHGRPPAIRWTQGGIIARDGHCRAFDADAAGTVGASAAALVVLRPLEDALADGDHVHAVIRGSAVNNDGLGKIGFTAPSVSGQAAVIRAAHLVAGVEPADIGYVETHGTATRLGDPIEIAALTQAFRAGSGTAGGGEGHCRIGSVKTNIGHTDAAAGAVGLIKTVLAVEHGLLPPSLHFERPNPELGLESSPFSVNADLRAWRPEGRPRLAGVSAFGVGGTNAHVVVEQPPPRPATAPAPLPHLLVWSARTATAAANTASRLAGRLRDRPDTDLADVAWTLQTGRTGYEHRGFAVCADTAEAAAALAGGSGAPATVPDPGRPPELVFMFPGQGGQHLRMAEGLYRRWPVFRARFDECAELAAPALATDLREVLFPDGEQAAVRAARRLSTIAVGQPAVFAVEYALAHLLADWGLRPAAVVGHSLGAYAAACFAGVFTPADAMRLVVKRGELLQRLPAGGMAAVRLPEKELADLLPAGLSIGAVNGPGQCTVTGPAELVNRFAAQLADKQIDARVLHIATAGHSALVEPVLEEFRSFVAGLDLAGPALPFLSDTTGDWAEASHLTDPGYWAAHLRRPVRFGQALSTLLTGRPRALAEIGPGRTLIGLARQHPGAGEGLVTVQVLPHPSEDASDLAVALAAAGRLWSHGHQVDWERLHDGERRTRVVLPGYPFERRRYLVPRPERVAGAPAAGGPEAWIADTDTTTPPLPAPREAGTAESTDPVADAVLTAFRGALGTHVTSPHDSFFDLGGDSLIATRLAAWARETFSVPLSPADILRTRTAAGLAALIADRTATP